jgi:hypothetical protein
VKTFRRAGSLAEEQLNRVEISRQTLVTVLSDLGVDHRQTTPFHNELRWRKGLPLLQKSNGREAEITQIRRKEHSNEGRLARGPPAVFEKTTRATMYKAASPSWGSERARVLCTDAHSWFARSSEAETCVL